MLTSGVSKSKAWLMYQAVDTFGPRWVDPKIDPRCEIITKDYDFERCASNAARPPLIRPAITRDQLSRFAQSMDGQIDGADLALLKSAIDRANR